MFGEPTFHSLMYMVFENLESPLCIWGIIESTPTCMPIMSSNVASVYV